MNLVAGIPDPVEFHLDLETMPQPLQAGRTGRIAVLHPRPMEGPPGQQLQRRAREAVSCIRGERGSAVLQARAPDACRRRRVSACRSTFRRRHVSRARRLLSCRRDAAAERRRRSSSQATRPRRCSSRRDYSPKSEREHARVAGHDPGAGDRGQCARSCASRFDPGGWTREVSRGVGAHAGREQRPHRHDSPASVSRGRAGRWSNSRWCFHGPRPIACGCSFSDWASSTPSNSTCR